MRLSKAQLSVVERRYACEILRRKKTATADVVVGYFGRPERLDWYRVDDDYERGGEILRWTDEDTMELGDSICEQGEAGTIEGLRITPPPIGRDGEKWVLDGAGEDGSGEVFDSEEAALETWNWMVEQQMDILMMNEEG